jgi:alpha-beta hydrolase superfamily lysophospholipase
LAHIPVLSICGGADTTVPLAENTAVVEDRYKKLGGPITLIVKPELGHHPHSLKDPTRIVEFVMRHAGCSAAPNP